MPSPLTIFTVLGVMIWSRETLIVLPSSVSYVGKQGREGSLYIYELNRLGSECLEKGDGRGVHEIVPPALEGALVSGFEIEDEVGGAHPRRLVAEGIEHDVSLLPAPGFDLNDLLLVDDPSSSPVLVKHLSLVDDLLGAAVVELPECAVH